MKARFMMRPDLPRPGAAKEKAGRAAANHPPHVAVAPDLLDQEHTVFREDDDADADHELRRRLLGAALRIARRQD
jgi:hypothetical protein